MWGHSLSLETPVRWLCSFQGWGSRLVEPRQPTRVWHLSNWWQQQWRRCLGFLVPSSVTKLKIKVNIFTCFLNYKGVWPCLEPEVLYIYFILNYTRVKYNSGSSQWDPVEISLISRHWVLPYRYKVPLVLNKTYYTSLRIWIPTLSAQRVGVKNTSGAWSVRTKTGGALENRKVLKMICTKIETKMTMMVSHQ